jgi:hypothetical protein
MKATGAGLESGRYSLNRGPCYQIRASCYVIFGLNERVFCYKSFASKELPLWRVPTINKPNSRKDLRSILAAGPSPGFRNFLSSDGMRRGAKRDFIPHV